MTFWHVSESSVDYITQALHNNLENLLDTSNGNDIESERKLWWWSFLLYQSKANTFDCKQIIFEPSEHIR